MRLRHGPRIIVDKPGKVDRLSDEKARNQRGTDELADALAAMSARKAPAPGDVDNLSAADDEMSAPPVDRSRLARVHPEKISSPARSTDGALELRRTLIPALLTMGSLMIVGGGMKWIAGEG